MMRLRAWAFLVVSVHKVDLFYFWKIGDMNWFCSTCTCRSVVNLLRKYPFTVLPCKKTVLLNVHLNCMHSLR